MAKISCIYVCIYVYVCHIHVHTYDEDLWSVFLFQIFLFKYFFFLISVLSVLLLIVTAYHVYEEKAGNVYEASNFPSRNPNIKLSQFSFLATLCRHCCYHLKLHSTIRYARNLPPSPLHHPYRSSVSVTDEKLESNENYSRTQSTQLMFFSCWLRTISMHEPKIKGNASESGLVSGTWCPRMKVSSLMPMVQPNTTVSNLWSLSQ